jgi:8-oxo-dGTP pyrophosphatase MutT (NUDIX family)
VHPDAIWAAVALVLVPHPDSLLLIRRAERSGDPWSGQVGLPGGRRDPDDATLLSTAVREAVEEVGVHLPANACLGELRSFPAYHLEDLVVWGMTERILSKFIEITAE